MGRSFHSLVAKSSERVFQRYLRATEVATGLPVPSVDQSTGLCGPASLRAVLLYFGVDKSEAELAKLSGANPEDGVRPEGLVRAARALGFEAYTKDGATLDDVWAWVAKDVPVIVDWFSTDEGHYSVVKALRGGKVYLMDPELGREREMALDAFQRVWFDFEGEAERHEGFVHRQIVVVTPR